jgi:hypothetical protein
VPGRARSGLYFVVLCLNLGWSNFSHTHTYNTNCSFLSCPMVYVTSHTTIW